jgi:hypothetical protein
MRRLLEAVKHSVGGVAKGLSSKITKNIDRDHTNPYPSTFPNQPAVESITFKSDWRLRAKPLELYPISKTLHSMQAIRGGPTRASVREANHFCYAQLSSLTNHASY